MWISLSLFIPGSNSDKAQRVFCKHRIDESLKIKFIPDTDMPFLIFKEILFRQRVAKRQIPAVWRWKLYEFEP